MFKNLCASALGLSGHQSEVIELALTFGFQGIDIDIGEFATRVKLRGVPYARRLIESAKLRLGSFALPLELDADDAVFDKKLAKLPEYAQVAADIGCMRSVTFVAPASEKLPYHENFEFHRLRVGAVAKVLEPAGVRLAVGFRAAEYLRKGQTFQFIHDLDALGLLLNMSGAPNVGLALDVWDLQVAAGSLDAIRKLPPAQIVTVDLANVPAGVAAAELQESSRLLPSAEGGLIDMPSVLLALSEIGYDGPVTVKPSRSVFRNQRREMIVKETGDSLTKPWKAAGLSVTGKVLAAARS
jgi:sugar phosphate isomerase/epimerase